jgi:hypothetical protein
MRRYPCIALKLIMADLKCSEGGQNGTYERRERRKKKGRIRAR